MASSGDRTAMLGNGAANCAATGLGRSYQVVVAATREMGIGKDGKLPWNLPTDLKFLKDLTSSMSDPEEENVVIMGRKAWDAIPTNSRPLPGRLNVVLTRSRSSAELGSSGDVITCGSMVSVLEVLNASSYRVSIEKVYVIGGGEILREAQNAPSCEAIHITEIENKIECDTIIPTIDTSVFQPWHASLPLVENGVRFAFVTYVRARRKMAGQVKKMGLRWIVSLASFRHRTSLSLPRMVADSHEEYKYLQLVQEILSGGTVKEDTTRTGTLSKFGCQMRFNLRKSFPLLTTKRVF